MKGAIVAVLWLASLGLAWLLGSNHAGDAPAHDGSERPTAPRVVEHEFAPGADVKIHAPAEKAPRAPAAPPPPPERAAEPATLSLDDLEGVDDLSARLMRYVDAQLARGPEGHKEILLTIDRLAAMKELQQLVRDEEDVIHLAYPWLKFAVEREGKLVGLMDTLYKTAAEDPAWFEQLQDDDPLALFTEGFAVMLPGVVGQDRLDDFRGYVETILTRDKQAAPRALLGNWRNFERNLRYWREPLSLEESRALLQDPAAPLARKLDVLRSLPKEQMAGVDVLGIVNRALREGQDNVIRMLGRLPLTEGDLVVLDRTFLDAVAKERVGSWYVAYYLSQTGRREWSKARPMIDEGLARGGHVTEACAQALLQYRNGPDAAYVQAVLDRYPVSENLANMLRSNFKLGKPK